MTIAFTIGNEVNYDKTLAESNASGRPMRKTGKGDQGRDPNYPGGWVFDSIESAHAAALDAPMILGSSAVFALYAIELPGTWDECTYEFNGSRHLLVDALVRCKVDEWLFWQRFDVEVLALGGDVAQARAAAEQLIELTSATRASARATVLLVAKRRFSLATTRCMSKGEPTCLLSSVQRSRPFTFEPATTQAAVDSELNFVFSVNRSTSPSMTRQPLSMRLSRSIFVAPRQLAAAVGRASLPACTRIPAPMRCPVASTPRQRMDNFAVFGSMRAEPGSSCAIPGNEPPALAVRSSMADSKLLQAAIETRAREYNAAIDRVYREAV